MKITWIEADKFEPVVTVDGKQYRPRVEMLVVKNDTLFMQKTTGNKKYGREYRIPGGGIQHGSSAETSARMETIEEARLVVGKVFDPSITFTTIYDKIPNWHKTVMVPKGVNYVGAITQVFVGIFSQRYVGVVETIDQDAAMVAYGKFYNISTVEHLLMVEHKRALELALSELVK